jgi:hypothetical protein
VDTYRAELEASMALIVYFVSIWPSGTTYGNRLQNLIYRTEVDQSIKVTQSKTLSDSLASTIGVRLSNISVKQKIFYGLLHIAVPYVWSRLERVSLNQRWADYPPGDWQRSAFELLSWFEMIWKCLNFINLIVFLYNGRFVFCSNLI